MIIIVLRLGRLITSLVEGATGFRLGQRAFRQIISSIDLFLSYWTDSTDPRTIYCFNSAQRLDLFTYCVRQSRL